MARRAGRLLLLVALLAAAPAGAFPFDASQPGEPARIELGGVPLAVWVADSEGERRIGLSERASLPPDGGLLFLFERSARHGIWMRRMLFAIDILWLDERGVVVDIRRNATPDSFPKVFHPHKNARYVLEVNAGFTEKSGIAIGDTARLPEPLKVR